MRIRSIAFENHPILGDLSFDFTDANGNIVDTIIIAGENGCGKTALLNELFLISFVPTDQKVGKKIISFELSDEEIQLILQDTRSKQIFRDGISSKEFSIVHDYSCVGWKQFTVKGNEYEFSGSSIGFFEQVTKRIFSDVEINFTPGNLSHVTSKDIDSSSKIATKSSLDLATEISQLLIDIKASDDSDLSDWVKDNPGVAPPESVQSIRMKRFTRAFGYMFPSLNFKGIYNMDNQKKVMFSDHERLIPIESLSSGEKQIVFRGGFLLKDKNSLLGAFALVDEPEISLHPNWQLKILPFLKELFTTEDGKQTSQLFVATHSPFILHNVNRLNDKVIVIQKNADGTKAISSNPEFYSWTPQTLIQEAFHIDLSCVAKRCVFLEGETDEIYYRKALDLFGYDNNEIAFNWIGENIAKGKAENTGDKALNNAAAFFKANPSILNKHIVLLYDCDTNKPSSDEGHLHIRCMIKNDANDHYRIGVENLLVLPSEFPYENYYEESIKSGNYGEVTRIQSLNKMKLCQDICKKSNVELESIFEKLKFEIQQIMEIPID